MLGTEGKRGVGVGMVMVNRKPVKGYRACTSLRTYTFITGELT